MQSFRSCGFFEQHSAKVQYGQYRQLLLSPRYSAVFSEEERVGGLQEETVTNTKLLTGELEKTCFSSLKHINFGAVDI
jgi:hypothetical protein